MFVANQSIDRRLSASYWSKALPVCMCFNADSETSWFCSIPKLENLLNHKAKISKQTFLNKDLQFLEGLEEFFRGNSRITSDCLVCSMLKTLSGRSMLAEIVRSSFTVRCALSELCSHICRFAIFNSVKSYNSTEERIISFERLVLSNHDKLPRENNSLTTSNASNYVPC